METNRLKIAVVGAGVAGVTAAHILQRKHDITLFEQNAYIGGHTLTVVLDHGPDAGTPIDMGFIVLNNHTYPTFHKLLSQLGIRHRDSEMSFSFVCEQKSLVYAGTSFGGLFAQKRNLFRPSFLRMLRDILRFGKDARASLDAGELKGLTLGEFLERKGYSKELSADYLMPMASAIWSAPNSEIFDFPAETFACFMRNHGLLSFKDRPQWQTVEGGSHAYIQAFLNQFKGHVIASCNIDCIRRNPDGVAISFKDGRPLMEFDHVVIGAHADQALALLGDPTPDEKRLLGAWAYQKNPTILHTDSRFLPAPSKARASWNYLRTPRANEDDPVSVTYWMNRLQGLIAAQNYCVTLNPTRSIPDEKIIHEVLFEHPLYNFKAVNTQAELPLFNGKNRTSFCGSYFGYGFHEDAVKSGVQAAQGFGMEL